ncbi:MAG TPA: hypothetical protein DEB39_12360, partial [Planctomycetaceae bacterium]|nr:hypothetical protein [Planctomycetaceae bacterium]
MYLCLCLLGIPLGIGVNLFVDRFGWERRRRSLVRPTGLCVIALCALALPLLYGWEIDARMLSQERMAVAQAGIAAEVQLRAAGPRESLVLRFLVHVVLFLALLAATLIDFEDMIIPDILTVSGTLAGLCIAFILPGVFLPATDYFPLSDGQPVLFPSSLYWCTPRDLAVHVPMVPIRPGQVVVALLLWYGWCFAMLNRTWYGRLGFRRAWLLFWRRLHRCPTTKRYAFLALLGSVFIPWAMLSGDLFRAHALFTALIGTAVGGGLVWSVRLIAGRVLRREAMGFGDVTFMAMIGAFLG